MKRITASVDSIGKVSTFIEHAESAIAHGAKSLFLLACEKNNFIPEQLDEKLSAFPVPVFGGIFPGFIYGKRIFDKGSLVVSLPYEVAVAQIGTLSDPETNFSEVVSSIADKFSSFQTALIFVDGAAKCIPAFLDGVYDQIGTDICYFGGGAGSRDFIQKPCLFSNKGLVQDHAQIVGIPFPCETGVAQGWRKLSGPLLVTESENNIIRTLDYRPAFDVYREIVAKESRERSFDANVFELFSEIAESESGGHPGPELFNTSKGYPLGVEIGESEALICTSVSAEGRQLVCMGEIPNFTPVHILKAEPEDLIRAAERAASELKEKFPEQSPEPLLVFDCFNRSLFLQDRCTEEIGILSEIWAGELFGAFTLGQVATISDGRPTLFNESVVIGAFTGGKETSSRQTANLVSTQYALAMLLRQEFDLIRSLRHFLPSALKLLNCRSGHIWLRDDLADESLLHRYSYPAQEYKRMSEYPLLMDGIANFSLAQPDIFIEHAAFFHLLPIGKTGVLVLRRNEPLPDTQVLALHPILSQLENVCLFAMRYAHAEHLKSAALQNEAQLNAELQAIRNTEKQLESLAHFDPLTNLPNRTQMAEDLKKAILHFDRSGGIFAVAFLDLDNFKSVNDLHGHEAGDNLLIEVANRLKMALRGGDSIARLGGDEFVLLLTEIKDVNDVEVALNRILADLSAPYQIDSIILGISTSIGVTVYPFDRSDAATLLQHADQAMYLAKQSGRNRFQWFDSALDRELKARHEKLEKLHAALRKEELKLYFQPKINLQTGEVIGFESLVRWQHPEEGLIGPAAFLPIVEQSHLIIQIGDWVLEEAVRQMAAWKEIGIDFPVSVNIAAKQFKYPGFVERLEGILIRYPNVPPSRLELEILETVVLDELEQTKETMLACQRIGVRFSLDDFGTGYSSLAYLKHLPIDTVKVDKSFVRDMQDNSEDLSIIESIISLARIFSRMVIAEGVESEEHGMLLLRLGCTFGQGYGIARPMPAEEVPDWLRQFKRGSA